MKDRVLPHFQTPVRSCIALCNILSAIKAETLYATNRCDTSWRQQQQQQQQQQQPR